MANLTAEQLKALQDWNAVGASGYQNTNPMFSNGVAYQSVFDTSGPSGMDAVGQPRQLQEYLTYDPNKTEVGDQYQAFKTDGTFDRTGQFQEVGAGPLVPLLAALSMGAFLPGGFLAGGVGGGAGSAAGFVGEGALSGIPAWDGALASSLSGAYGPAGLATAAGGTSAMGAGASGAAAGGGGLSNLTGLLGGGGGSNLLGIGSTLLGAALGSKGQEASQTQTRDIPEWLKPYVLGQGGLLQGAQQTYQRQMSPGYLDGLERMMQSGQSLMNRPIARNPFGG